MPFERNSVRIAAVFWLLAATVLVNSYAGILTSSLTFTKQSEAIDSLEDLADATNVSLTIPTGMVIYHEMMVEQQSLAFIGLQSQFQFE